MTNNFGDELVIGVGGFGKVYKGFIDNGATTVAIKRLDIESQQEAEEFWTEVKMLSKLRHTHLVALIGQCNDCQEMILVYEYVARGTLADYIYKTSRKESGITTSALTWEQRLNICIGAARGLDCLHTGTDQSFIHGDVKTTNILLDENWVSQDFRFWAVRRPYKPFSNPLLCGRPPVDIKLEEDQISLILWAQECIKKGKLDRIIDPSLSGQITPEFEVFCKGCLQLFTNSSKGKAYNGSSGGEPQSRIGVTTYESLVEGKKGDSSKSGLSNDLFWEPLPDSVTRPHHHFSLADIQAATNDFNKLLLVGNEGLCKLYKGFLGGETGIVAKLKEATAKIEIARIAFETAQKRCGKLSSIDKANVLEVPDASSGHQSIRDSEADENPYIPPPGKYNLQTPSLYREIQQNLVPDASSGHRSIRDSEADENPYIPPQVDQVRFYTSLQLDTFIMNKEK
ncbi:hypothetical protein TEA_026316 [Camellia sinensis var. sinensis]|uniref:Protein kinase domain-containing protein n=1 Tax=Camellia sinensis var. sinensis TaxID=542762 RepID=A0A4S4DKI3_CAMSN|nr:hypothetical protein TEA_026316 [Camellia sinensis var. sinensis]